MQITKRLRQGITGSAVGLSALALTFGLGMLAPPVAHATPSCVSLYICLWDGVNYSGALVYAGYANYSPGTCFTIAPSAAKNVATSYISGTSTYLYWYDGDNCTGVSIYTSPPHGGTPQLISSANNRVNSFRVAE